MQKISKIAWIVTTGLLVIYSVIQISRMADTWALVSSGSMSITFFYQMLMPFIDSPVPIAR